MKYKDFEKEFDLKDLKLFSIGKSVLGKDLIACHVGKESGKQVFIQAGIHAREYVTSLLALSQAQELSRKNLNYGVYFVFCANPDGVKVILDGFSALRDKERQFCEEKGFDHKLFKANANLVDLNTNFDALWGQGRSNVFSPNFENYVGEKAESEPETKALRHFAEIIKPCMTLSYHTKGEVIYYGFDTQSNQSLRRDKDAGMALGKSLGFALERSFFSCGGFKDWACDRLDVPSFTIEFGNDSLTHPLTEKCLFVLKKQSEILFDTIEDIIF